MNFCTCGKDSGFIIADNNRKRRDIVRTRTAQYLQHAEELHLKYLGPKTPTLAKVHTLALVGCDDLTQ